MREMRRREVTSSYQGVRVSKESTPQVRSSLVRTSRRAVELESSIAGNSERSGAAGRGGYGKSASISTRSPLPMCPARTLPSSSRAHSFRPRTPAVADKRHAQAERGTPPGLVQFRNGRLLGVRVFLVVVELAESQGATRRLWRQGRAAAFGIRVGSAPTRGASFRWIAEDEEA